MFKFVCCLVKRWPKIAEASSWLQASGGVRHQMGLDEGRTVGAWMVDGSLRILDHPAAVVIC